MEEEKQQLLQRIQKLEKRVEGIPDCEKWLTAARQLRFEQLREAEFVEKCALI